MATTTSRLGKCSNFGNCTLADARKTIEVSSGNDFVCSECGKPLLPIDGNGKPAGGRAGMIVAAVAGALVLAGAAWFFTRERAAPPPPPPPPPAPAVVAPPALPSPPAVTAPSTVPVTGDCSTADERAGLCRRPR